VSCKSTSGSNKECAFGPSISITKPSTCGSADVVVVVVVVDDDDDDDDDIAVPEGNTDTGTISTHIFLHFSVYAFFRENIQLSNGILYVTLKPFLRSKLMPTLKPSPWPPIVFLSLVFIVAFEACELQRFDSQNAL